jgi:hypothetical protein
MEMICFMNPYLHPTESEPDLKDDLLAVAANMLSR